MNHLVRYTFLPGLRSVWWVIPDMRRDYRCLTACQKQYNQNELPGQVDVPARVEVCVKEDPRHVYWPETFHRLSKTIETVWTSWLGRSLYWGGRMCDTGSQIHLGTTDVSLPVRNNTVRMNWLARKTFLLEWRSVWLGIPDMYRNHRHLIACQKQYR